MLPGGLFYTPPLHVSRGAQVQRGQVDFNGVDPRHIQRDWLVSLPYVVKDGRHVLSARCASSRVLLSVQVVRTDLAGSSGGLHVRLARATVLLDWPNYHLKILDARKMYEEEEEEGEM